MTEQPGTSPAQPEGATPGVPAPPEQPKSRGAGKQLLYSLLGIAVVVAIGFVVRVIIAEATGDLSTAGVGDCIDNKEDINDVRVVGCDSEEAFWEVVSVQKDVTKDDFDTVAFEELCPTVTDEEASAIWYGEERVTGFGKGDVYCVVPLSSSS
ncbi:MAG TPA: hypothetical protein VKY81_05940 [Natronosporangium sp.]|nr:hypothetical protein [Natronosporangium sp.]